MWKWKSFEDECASAGTNQLSPDEYEQMIEQAEHCPSCHTAHEEFSASLQQLRAEERDKMNGALRRHIEKGGLRERFIERARAEGIQFSAALKKRHDNKGWNGYRLALPYRWVGAVALLGMVVAGLGYRAAHHSVKRSLETRMPAPLSGTRANQDRDAHELEAKLTELQAALEASNETISRQQDEISAMVLRIGGLEKDLAGGRAENQALSQSLAGLSDRNAQMASQNDHNAQLLFRARAELEEARARGTQMEAEIGAARAEAGTLSQQLKSQTATLSRERDLLAAGRDITDLMGARNLHIIDVHDADGKGKNKRAFGRIFYTEGRSLIFYAYDLDERKLARANYSLDVWGEQLGEPASVRNLGILYVDDKDQKRWTLKVDNPQQLAEIDSVFVTLEPHDPGDKPRGQKILFAFLGGQANHP